MMMDGSAMFYGVDVHKTLKFKTKKRFFNSNICVNFIGIL